MQLLALKGLVFEWAVTPKIAPNVNIRQLTVGAVVVKQKFLWLL